MHKSNTRRRFLCARHPAIAALCLQGSLIAAACTPSPTAQHEPAASDATTARATREHGAPSQIGRVAGTGSSARAATPVAAFPNDKTLLAAQARFAYETDATGKERPVPQAATLLLLRAQEGAFVGETLIDPDSRVFHKAACVDFGEGPRILTIGGSDAFAKLWQRDGDGWHAATLWHPKFGGTWDRLRDFEKADVTGDGQDDLVIATHDQGVVAVATYVGKSPGAKWQATTARKAPGGKAWYVLEVYRRPNTFIHEVEVGDVDGDGVPEFFVTPSTPNTLDAAQSGEILVFHRDGRGGFVSEDVARFRGAHVKEILSADLDGNGKSELYAAVEPTRASGGSGAVEVRSYVREGKRWKSQTIASVDGALQARVLLVAELDGSGQKEIVMTTMKAGIWRLTPPSKSARVWTKTLIDADSQGFEHAANVADLDGDGRPELYVSADEQDEIRRYTFAGARPTRTTIFGMERGDITWNIEPCRTRH